MGFENGLWVRRGKHLYPGIEKVRAFVISVLRLTPHCLGFLLSISRALLSINPVSRREFVPGLSGTLYCQLARVHIQDGRHKNREGLIVELGRSA